MKIRFFTIAGTFFGFALSSSMLFFPETALLRMLEFGDVGMSIVRHGLFFAGAFIFFHSLLLRQALRNKVFQKAIDYFWYFGSISSIALASAVYLKDQQVLHRQVFLANYSLFKSEALQDLDALIRHCEAVETVAVTKDRLAYPAPNILLCSFASDLRVAWLNDQIVAQLGINPFDLHPSDISYISQEASQSIRDLLSSISEIAPEYVESDMDMFTDFVTASFCREALQHIEHAYKKVDLETAMVERSLTLSNSPIRSIQRQPPHSYGNDACYMLRALEEEARKLPSNKLKTPVFVLWMTQYWLFLLSALVGFRLVKTSAEIWAERRHS
ncbi:MAG: hypothetical protein ABJQ70_02855 [Roseobacter sp.]